MTDDTYHTLQQPSEGLYKEKGSRFLAFAHPVSSEAEIKTIIEAIRKTHFSARHHCYAYIIGPHQETFRVNDDGEPSGTAGKPIYGQLLSFGLTNTLIVVVRYFGGIKLGTSGLINAYRTAARDALTHAIVIEKTIDVTYRVRFPFEQMNSVMRILKEIGASPRNQQYDMDCSLDFCIRQSLSDKVRNTLGKLRGISLTEINPTLNTHNIH